MTPRALCLLIATCLGTVPCLAMDAPPSPPAPDTRTGLPMFPVADIPATLAALGDVPPTTATRLAVPAMLSRDTPMATWVTSTSLADPARRADVRRLLDEGKAVLVTSVADEPRHELETFGVEPSGRMAIFLRTDTGLSVTSVVAEVRDPSGAAARQHAVDAVFDTMNTRVSDRFARDNARTSRSVDEPEQDEPTGAFVRIEQQVFDIKDRAARQTIHVARDATVSRDEKVITVDTTLDVTPQANGSFHGNSYDPKYGQYSPNGISGTVMIADQYQVETAFTPEGPDAGARLVDAIPKTQALTDRKVVHELTTKITSSHTFGGDVTPTVDRQKDDKNKDDKTREMTMRWGGGGKLAYSYAWASEETIRTAVEMEMADYSIFTDARRDGDATIVNRWSFPLSDAIRANFRYFDTKDELVSTEKMTPMMRRAQLHAVSEWRVNGAYEGTVQVASRGTVANRKYRYLRGKESASAPVVEERSSFAITPPPWMEGYNENQYRISGGFQPWIVSKVDLSSPYLTRSPTILIQSQVGTGDCLSAKEGAVGLARCDEGDVAQQWNFEADHTYRNRADGSCLTTDEGGMVTTAACQSNMLNQQWQWMADRIHSMVDGGQTWHLHLRDGVLSARFDEARHQKIAANPFHPLLNPWSSYPAKPGAGDWVPTLSGPRPAFQHLPGVTYRDVEANERWETIPLRHGL